MHLFGFIIGTYHDARSFECQNVFFVLFRLCIFILICFVCTSARLLPPSDNSIEVSCDDDDDDDDDDNDNNNNNNNNNNIEHSKEYTAPCQ